MKTIQVVIPLVVSRALSARYDVPKLQNALDADYNNDGRKGDDAEKLAVNTVTAGIQSAKVKEGKTDGAKGEFKSVDVHKIERSGELNNPRRMIAWLVAFAKFMKANGEPSGEITADVLPAGLVFWLEAKFLKDEFKPKDGAKANVSGRRPASNGVHSSKEEAANV